MYKEERILNFEVVIFYYYIIQKITNKTAQKKKIEKEGKIRRVRVGR